MDGTIWCESPLHGGIPHYESMETSSICRCIKISLLLLASGKNVNLPTNKNEGLKIRTTIWITTVLFFAFYTQRIIAQEKESFAGISAGFAIPYGNFSAAVLPGGSFAITGLAVNAEGAWFLTPKFGIGASVGFHMNPIWTEAQEWVRIQSDPFLYYLSIRSEPFTTVTAMAGGYTKLPIWRNFSFTGKLLGGLLYGRTPYQLHKSKYIFLGPSYYEITPAKDWKFSWQAGAGIQYDISPCVGLLLEGVIMYDKLSFDFRTADGIRTDIHTIALINTSLGVRIKI